MGRDRRKLRSAEAWWSARAVEDHALGIERAQAAERLDDRKDIGRRTRDDCVHLMLVITRVMVGMTFMHAMVRVRGMIDSGDTRLPCACGGVAYADNKLGKTE